MLYELDLFFPLLVMMAAVSGSIDECWFDTTGIMESDFDDDFHSVQDGM